ncbi:MAG: TAXI family TRAP transporter solute-binding subunit [Rhodospirillales bacterium]
MKSSKKSKPSVFGGETGTVGKAMTIIRYFVDHQESWGVRELAATLDQPQSSVHRILKNLKAEGLLEFNQQRQKYEIGLEFFRIAAVINQKMEFSRIAHPYLRDLVEEVDETCVLSILDLEEQRVVHVSARECSNPLRYEPPVGLSEPLSECSMGWACLAFLSVRDRANVLDGSALASSVKRQIEAVEFEGVAVQISEGKEAAARVSAPVMGSDGRPVGAMTLVIPRYRYDPADIADISDALLNRTRTLSRAMGSRFLGGGTSGSWHAGMAAIAGIVGERALGFSATPTMGGGSQNLEDIHAGTGAYCLTTLSSLFHAYNGMKPYKFKHDKLRALMNVSTMDLQIVVRADLEITKFTDIASFRISPGQQGFSTSETFYELLEVCGLSEKKIAAAGGEIIHLEYAEAKRQFLEGDIDVLVWFTGMPNVLLHDFDETKARMLVLDPAVCDDMIAKCPAYSCATISKDMYPWLSEDILALRVPTTMVSHKDRESDEVYKVTKTVFEQREELMKISNAFTLLNEGFAKEVLSIPIHAGARKYWEEG